MHFMKLTLSLLSNAELLLLFPWCFNKCLDIQILNRQGLMDCALRDWQICQNYKQSAIIFIRKFWMSSWHDSGALSLKALAQRMLSGSCYFRLWALLWDGWRDLESDWIFRADEPWKVQGVDVMPHSNCPGNFSRFRNIPAAEARTRTQQWGNNSG